jgi:hypothetical protein
VRRAAENNRAPKGKDCIKEKEGTKRKTPEGKKGTGGGVHQREQKLREKRRAEGERTKGRSGHLREKVPKREVGTWGRRHKRKKWAPEGEGTKKRSG